MSVIDGFGGSGATLTLLHVGDESGMPKIETSTEKVRRINCPVLSVPAE